MSLEDWKNLFEIIQSLVSTIAIIVAGIWAYTKFIYRREKEPRAEFTVDLDFVGIQDEYWLVEISAYVENKGLVRHTVKDFKVNVRYLLRDEEIADGDEDIKFQVEFPHSINERIGDNDRILWNGTYIDPNIRHRNSYITTIPVTATFALLFGKFEYENEYFTAQRLFKIPTSDKV